MTLGRETVLDTQMENVLQNLFRESGRACKTWLKLFLKRHKDKQSERKPTRHMQEHLNLIKKTWTIFFQLLNEMYEKYYYPPNRIYNIDIAKKKES